MANAYVARDEQPINAAVVRWAINESGYSPAELDALLEESPGTVVEWARGNDRPTLVQLRRLAGALKRPMATFYLPKPPETSSPQVSFRSTPKSNRKHLKPQELIHLREAHRLQRILSWIDKETGARTGLPTASLNSDLAALTENVRAVLGIDAETQASWTSTSKAFDGWRSAFERIGVFVFQFSLGGGSSKGFSLWDDYAPVVAVNTHWNEAARIFTLFHELGHLLTRTNSVCLNPGRHLLTAQGDTTERWCERFAALVLIPKNELADFLAIRFNWTNRTSATLQHVQAIATRFNVSLRAAAIRMIELGLASWNLYESIPVFSEDKRKGGGGSGRVRRVMREDAYGPKTTTTFLGAIERELITTYDAMSYLRVSDLDVASWATNASAKQR